MSEPIKVPANYIPRFYQVPFLNEVGFGEGRKRRACLVWHRRSGKTMTLVNFVCREAHKRRGVYWHMFPFYNQGRKVVWDSVNEESGRSMIDEHMPSQLRKGKNKVEMKVELKVGSVYQVVGADNWDAIVGPNPLGIIFDEWSKSDKYVQAWNYLRPILANNGGWAVFVYTPMGRNHGWETYERAMGNAEWFWQLLTVEDTKIPGILVEIEKERRDGMPESMIQQEFYCSFLADVAGVLIRFELIQEALRKEINTERMNRIGGLDVARFGNDRCAFVVRQGGAVNHAESWQGIDLVQTTGRMRSAWNAHLFDILAIDVTGGLGAGPYDMLKNAKIPVVAVNVSEREETETRFVRLRDELWWRLREWFETKAVSISRSINKQDRDALIKDIQDIHYEYDPRGLIKIESKEDMKERLGFSPDYGDALCCTFSPEIPMQTTETERLPYSEIYRKTQEWREDNYNPLDHGLEA